MFGRETCTKHTNIHDKIPQKKIRHHYLLTVLKHQITLYAIDHRWTNHIEKKSKLICWAKRDYVPVAHKILNLGKYFKKFHLSNNWYTSLNKHNFKLYKKRTFRYYEKQANYYWDAKKYIHLLMLYKLSLIMHKNIIRNCVVWTSCVSKNIFNRDYKGLVLCLSMNYSLYKYLSISNKNTLKCFLSYMTVSQSVKLLFFSHLCKFFLNILLIFSVFRS